MPHCPRTPPLEADELERVRLLYAGDQATNAEIGRPFGKGGPWVNRLAREHGWPLRARTWRRGAGAFQGAAAKPKPATVDGTKARRPRAGKAKTAREIIADRQAEEAKRAHDIYGDLLRDVEYLRRTFAVTREGSLIRVGGTLRTEDEVRAIAARERRLEQPEPEMLKAIAEHRDRRPVAPSTGPSPKMLPAPIVTTLKCDDCGGARTDPARAVCRVCMAERARELNAGTARRTGFERQAPPPPVTIQPPAPEPKACGCGRLASHLGRCWARRGTEPPAVKVPPPAPPMAKTPPRRGPACEKCGGPRSSTSGALCRGCYLASPAVRRGGVTPTQESALEAALHGGASIREAGRRAGVAGSTAYKLAAELGPADFMCKCGRPSSHDGRCWARRGLPEPPAQVAHRGTLTARMDALEAKVAELGRLLKGAPA